MPVEPESPRGLPLAAAVDSFPGGCRGGFGEPATGPSAAAAVAWKLPVLLLGISTPLPAPNLPEGEERPLAGRDSPSAAAAAAAAAAGVFDEDDEGEVELATAANGTPSSLHSCSATSFCCSKAGEETE